jgi:hypothetical protein
MPALDPQLRRELERTIIEARNVTVKAIESSLRQLTVHEGKRGSHLSDEETTLRNRLRAHGRQIGDRRNSQSGVQAIDRLVQECAYEQWHRMIFVRFLAENELLIDPEFQQAISMDGLREIADESHENIWEMGGRFASAALPAVFRPDDSLLQVSLPLETQKSLEALLNKLPAAVFTADDSLGWVYQFWQSDEKERVNKEGSKITGRTLPAVTQLFTEHYMVLFLLHNTIGAWHAGKVLASNPELARTAKDESELRRAVALTTGGGYQFEYLRFVRESNSSDTPSASVSGKALAAGSSKADGSDDTSAASAVGSQDDSGAWRPMGGTFPGWPTTAAELRVLDPSCGSGHFLVAALELLVYLRMQEESLDIQQATEAVLRDNLFGLEIDPRCTQIAAFNLAMAAWKVQRFEPQSASRKRMTLPPMNNIACSGIPLGNSREDWMKSLHEALPDSKLGFYWGQLYDMFSQAETLGSLINPQRFFASGMINDEQLDQLASALTTAVAKDPNATDEQQELAAAAQGLTRAAELLAGRYTLVITNVPYLGRGKQDDVLKKYLDAQYNLGKADLATAFVLRCLEFCAQCGSTALVTPQNWLFLGTYKKLRETLLERRQWDFVAKLGPGAFETIGGHVVNVALVTLTAGESCDNHQMAGIDVTAAKSPDGKAAQLYGKHPARIIVTPQENQLQNPDAVIAFEVISGTLLSNYATSTQGIKTGDDDKWRRTFWELSTIRTRWKLLQSSITSTTFYAGREGVIDWEGQGCSLARLQGMQAWNSMGVAVKLMGLIPATMFTGECFDSNIAPITPKNPQDLCAIWMFCESGEFANAVRRVNTKVNIAEGTVVKVPFDLSRWHKAAVAKYPNGLPDPESDDPTQWLFHGRPEQSSAPMQVAVARLLGYRWPAELDREMRLSQRARGLVARCHELDEFSDDDGIVCIPSLRGEDPASDRLLRLLHAAGVTHNEDLDDWLRNRFFQEHCELFHQRPFIWHIWDGRRDGFSALVSYHKLTGPSGRKLLESLTYSYLADWITRQDAAVKANEPGADARLMAARELQQRLEAILLGEPPYDIFVRWKPLHQQPIGWTPDINDGVRMNIRPFMAADLSGGRKGAGILRFPPKIKWTKDRGAEPKRPIDEYPWFWSWDEKTLDFMGGEKFTGERWNDCHYTIKAKQAARKTATGSES